MVNTDKHHVAHHVAAPRIYDLGDANTPDMYRLEVTRRSVGI